MPGPDPSNPAPDRPASGESTPGWLRPILTLAGLAGVALAAHYGGLLEHIDAEWVRRTVESTGVWGVVAFTGVFAVGELLHVPGLVFVGAAALAYGRLAGVAVALLGAVVSVTFSFLVVRRVGGQPFDGLEGSFAQRFLTHLDERPVITVAVLRSLLWMAPALNYGLAMTGVRLRDYVVGSALGLVLPVGGAVFFFDWLLV